MKKVIGLLIIMAVFCLGFGAGHYFTDSGLEIPGLAMASSDSNKPKIVSVDISDMSKLSGGKYKWCMYIKVDRPVVYAEEKTAYRAAIFTK